MRNVYVSKVYVQPDLPVLVQLNGAIRGQHVEVNGMRARVANVTDSVVVLAMRNDDNEVCLAQYR